MNFSLEDGQLRYSNARLLASAGSLDAIRGLIGEFYHSKNIRLEQVAADTWAVHNANGRIDGVQVVQRKGRYRFEAV